MFIVQHAMDGFNVFSVMHRVLGYYLSAEHSTPTVTVKTDDVGHKGFCRLHKQDEWVTVLFSMDYHILT